MLLLFSAVAQAIGRTPDRGTRLWIYRNVRTGNFPAPVRLSTRRIAWRRSEVETWMDSRPKVSYAKETTNVSA